MSDQLTTSPIKLSAADRDLVVEVQGRFEGISRHVVQRAAMRYGLRAALDDPACLGPYLVSPASGLVETGTRTAGGSSSRATAKAEVSKPRKTTAEKVAAVEEPAEVELEGFGPDCDFAINPMA